MAGVTSQPSLDVWCEPYRARMTRKACALQFNTQKPPFGFPDRRFHCRRCEEGKRNAGLTSGQIPLEKRCKYKGCERVRVEAIRKDGTAYQAPWCSEHRQPSQRLQAALVVRQQVEVRAEDLERANALSPMETMVMATVLELSGERGVVAPQEIGLHHGRDPHTASSWACAHLCRFIEDGLVYRKERGSYALTPRGQRVAMAIKAIAGGADGTEA